MVAGLGGDRLPGLERDVRRVADHDVDGAVEVVEGVGHVAVPQVDAGAGQVAGGPARARRRRARRRAPRRPAPRSATRQRDRPGAGARGRRRPAPGRRPRRPAPARPPSRRAARSPGAARTPRARPRSSTWRNAARAGQVLQRLAGGAARDQRVVRLGLRRRSTASTSAQPGRVGAEHVREQLGGVVLRAGHAGLARAGAAACRERSVGPALTRAQCLERVEPGREVGLDAGVEDRLEVAVEHLVEVVGLVAGAVVGDPVLRVVVGADPLGAVDRADLAAARVAGLGVGGVLGGLRAAGPAGCASPAPCSAAGSSRSGS